MMQQDLSAILGVRLDEVINSSFVRSLGEQPKTKLIHDRFYMDLPKSGITFVASLDGRVSSIQLHAAGYEGYNEFVGVLPGGVAFNDSRRAVRLRLGQPSAT